MVIIIFFTEFVYLYMEINIIWIPQKNLDLYESVEDFNRLQHDSICDMW